MHTNEEERTKEPNHRSSRSLFLLRASRTYENSSACVNMSRPSPQDPHHPGYFDPSPGVAQLLRPARLSPSSFPLPNTLQRTPALLRTESLPRGSRGTQELFVATRSVAGIIKKNLGLITLAASSTASPPACSFLSRTRSRYRRLWVLRFSLPAVVARYFCCAFHADHFRAFSRHRALQ